MFNLRIRMRSRKNREYLQNVSSNPSGKWCNRIFGSFLRRKKLTILLVRVDHPKVPLPTLKLPLCAVCYSQQKLSSYSHLEKMFPNGNNEHCRFWVKLSILG